MLVVLGLIGLLTAILAPRVDFQHYQIEGGMQAVATALMAAQREAVGKQHDIAVMFDQTPAQLPRANHMSICLASILI